MTTDYCRECIKLHSTILSNISNINDFNELKKRLNNFIWESLLNIDGGLSISEFKFYYKKIVKHMKFLNFPIINFNIIIKNKTHACLVSHFVQILTYIEEMNAFEFYNKIQIITNN